MKYFAPGRVNLIGEHIDYSGGNVFPIAIDMGTYGSLTLRKDSIITIHSLNFKEDGILSFSLEEPIKHTHKWFDYVLGVIDVFIKKGYQLKQGFDLIIEGNIPNSSGLSSSASLEVLIAFILNDLNKLSISRPDIALFSMKAENDFVGVQCGIMDQFIISNGIKNKALNLNCNTLEYDLVNCDFKEYQLLILNSKVKRGLVDSAYNERRMQCSEGLKIIQEHYPNIKEICMISLRQLYLIKDSFTPIVFKRIVHAVSEQARVIESVKALNKGNIVQFAQFLNESHYSLRDDYEVSIKELDFLQEKALAFKAIGSRMTGAGFGGCLIALVHKEHVDTFKVLLIKAYYDEFKLDLEIYDANVSDGVKSYE